MSDKNTNRMAIGGQIILRVIIMSIKLRYNLSDFCGEIFTIHEFLESIRYSNSKDCS